MGLSYQPLMSKLCTAAKGFLNGIPDISPVFLLSYSLPAQPSRKNCGSFRRRSMESLLCPEGLAVGALVLGGIMLVGAHQNPVQGAVVLGIAVVSAGLDGAFNALVGVTIHVLFLLLFGTALVWPEIKK